MTSPALRTLATIGCATLLAACPMAITEPTKAVVAKGVTAVALDPAAPVADGTSIVNLKITIDTVVRPANNQVTVTTTAGALLPAGTPTTLTANDSGFAYAQLRAPTDAGTAIVTFVAAGAVHVERVTFAPAQPDRVQLTASALAIKAGPLNTIDLTAQLLRKVGTVSPGATVVFSADTAGGKTGNLGVFSPKSLTSSTNTIGAKFSAGNTAFLGPAIVRVLVTRDNVSVSDSITVQIVPP